MKHQQRRWWDKKQEDNEEIEEEEEETNLIQKIEDRYNRAHVLLTDEANILMGAPLCQILDYSLYFLFGQFPVHLKN